MEKYKVKTMYMDCLTNVELENSKIEIINFFTRSKLI